MRKISKKFSLEKTVVTAILLDIIKCGQDKHAEQTIYSEYHEVNVVML